MSCAGILAKYYYLSLLFIYECLEGYTVSKWRHHHGKALVIDGLRFSSTKDAILLKLDT